MFLRCRPIHPSELPDCVSCIRDRFAYEPHERPALVALWQELLAAKCAMGRLIEDLDAPPALRIVWFAFHVFPCDPWAEALKRAGPPLPGRQLLDRWRRGDLPIMTETEIRRANSGGEGLTLLSLNSGSAPEIMASYDTSVLTNKITETQYYAGGGFRLREVLIEGYGPWQWAWLENFGARVRNDYEGHYAAAPPSREDHRARLYGISKAEAEARAGCTGSQLFGYVPPRFAFSSLQQDLLMTALAFETDEEISQHLGVALVTIRKRWAAIYERVQSVAPALLAPADTSLPEARRGEEAPPAHLPPAPHGGAAPP